MNGAATQVRPNRLIRAVLAGLLVSIGASGPGIAFDPERSVSEHVAFLRPGVDVRLPDTASGPVATAILFHGCGGRRAMQDDYAAALNEAGYGAIIVDSLTPRGIGRFGAMTQVCTAMRLRGQARAADIYAGVAMARSQAGVDADRLVVVGWSHGGWAKLDALSYEAEGRNPTGLGGEASLAGVQTALLIYPYCGLPARSRNHSVSANVRLDAILAGRDLVASTTDCRRTLERARVDGAAVTYETWPGLTHAFDEAGNPDPRMTYNAEAAVAAHQRLIGILDELSAH